MKHEIWIHRRALILFLMGGIAAFLAGHFPNGSMEQFLLRQISPMAFGAAMVGWQFETYRSEREQKLAQLYRELTALIDGEDGKVVYQDEVEGILVEAVESADFQLEPSPLPTPSN